MVMNVRRSRTSPRDAVAMVMKARNETRLRLLLQRPDSLFALLSPRSAGSQVFVLYIFPSDTVSCLGVEISIPTTKDLQLSRVPS